MEPITDRLKAAQAKLADASEEIGLIRYSTDPVRQRVRQVRLAQYLRAIADDLDDHGRRTA